MEIGCFFWDAFFSGIFGIPKNSRGVPRKSRFFPSVLIGQMDMGLLGQVPKILSHFLPVRLLFSRRTTAVCSTTGREVFRNYHLTIEDVVFYQTCM